MLTMEVGSNANRVVGFLIITSNFFFPYFLFCDDSKDDVFVECPPTVIFEACNNVKCWLRLFKILF